VKAACGKTARAVWAADGGQRRGHLARLLRPDKTRKRSKSFAKVSSDYWLDTKIICPGDRWNQPAILSAWRFLLPGISRAQPLVILSWQGDEKVSLERERAGENAYSTNHKIAPWLRITWSSRQLRHAPGLTMSWPRSSGPSRWLVNSSGFLTQTRSGGPHCERAARPLVRPRSSVNGPGRNASSGKQCPVPGAQAESQDHQ
jgi:hypothetical protein